MSKLSRTLKALCVLTGLFCVLNSLFPTGCNNVIANKEEIRGVWAATLYSMDYPTKPTTSAEALRQSADTLLNNVQNLVHNTIFFQTRPAGDAFYKSEIFPWSKYLTGTSGIAPSDKFDPLKYLCQEAHKRGIALHAWINPYRLTISSADENTLPDNAISKKYPHLTVKHTDGKLYLNPGEPESNKLVVDGLLEIVKNYDIDGIHLDDYFYPDSSFPDGKTFTDYGGEFADIGDWRRNNTTELIKAISTAIKSENPDIIFSVSPCGIWANNSSHPDGSNTNGIQAYYDYYADTRLWVKENLVDWIIPQVYWNFGHSAADFETVVKWWADTVRGTDVSLCIGQAAYKVAEETGASSVWYSQNGIAELIHQTEFVQALDGCTGYSHYRLGSILQTPQLQDFAIYANTGKQPLFTDISAYPWAIDAITNLHQKGIIKGMGDGTFGCERQVSRADFTLMLVRLLGKDAQFTDNFADVTDDKYYYKEIGIAKALGITSGRDGKTFDPMGYITREDMAVMVYRILEKENVMNIDENINLFAKFSDAHSISEYAVAAVSAMAENELLSGYETGEFKPQGFATRAETAVFLNRVAGLL